MKRASILTGMLAAGAMGLTLAASQSTAWARSGKSGQDTPTTQTVKLFAVGDGSGTDDKNTGSCTGFMGLPALTCSTGDFCGCLAGSAPDFSGAGVCKASLTAMEVSFDFSQASEPIPNGIPNGTDADTTIPLAGRCYGASGLATVTSADTAGDTINLLLQGVFCDAIPEPTTSNKGSFNGTYMIEGGTGPYAAATGTGSFTASIDDVNALPATSPMTFSATGSITALLADDGSCACNGGDSGDSDSDGDCHSHNHNGHGDD